jgi:DNA polymerase I-like protein with 3'-5' exonuclease and polymerase domains
MIVQCDAKSLEWLTYLYLSQDKTGIEEWFNFLKDPKLNDIHTNNQNDLQLSSRLVSKIFLFRCIYRGPAFAYANDPLFKSVSKSDKFWQNVIDRFFDKYQGLNKTHIKLINEATTTGKTVSPFGRVHLHTPKKNRFGGYKWNESDICNHINQGVGADVMAVARVSCYNKWKTAGLSGLLISTVHDSIVADVPDHEVEAATNIFNKTFEDLASNISKCYNIDWNIPLICEVKAGPNQNEGKEIVVAT